MKTLSIGDVVIIRSGPPLNHFAGQVGTISAVENNNIYWVLIEGMPAPLMFTACELEVLTTPLSN